MDFKSFKDWALLSLLTGGVVILWQMKEGLSTLNTKLEVVIAEQKITNAQTTAQISDHEHRLRQLENKKH